MAAELDRLEAQPLQPPQQVSNYHNIDLVQRKLKLHTEVHAALVPASFTNTSIHNIRKAYTHISLQTKSLSHKPHTKPATKSATKPSAKSALTITTRSNPSATPHHIQSPRNHIFSTQLQPSLTKASDMIDQSDLTKLSAVIDQPIPTDSTNMIDQPETEEIPDVGFS